MVVQASTGNVPPNAVGEADDGAFAVAVADGRDAVQRAGQPRPVVPLEGVPQQWQSLLNLGRC